MTAHYPIERLQNVVALVRSNRLQESHGSGLIIGWTRADRWPGACRASTEHSLQFARNEGTDAMPERALTWVLGSIGAGGAAEGPLLAVAAQVTL